MNVIIIAACIPTLRPLFLILFKRPGASRFPLSRNRRHLTYRKTSNSSDPNPPTVGSVGAHKAFGGHNRYSSAAGINAPQNTQFSGTDGTITSTTTIRVYSREVDLQDDREEGEWGHVKGSGVPLSQIDHSARESVADA